MNKTRKANRKFLPKNCRVEEIDLTDPNVDQRHRDQFTTIVKAEVAELDERICSWYRHVGECGIEGCDCGLKALVEKAEIMYSHLRFIKEAWGEVIIDQHPYLAKFTKEFASDGAYKRLSSRPIN
jgi:hypothetical protein